MSQEKKLPWKVIRGMQWYLGLPDKFLKDPVSNLDSSFKVVEMEDGLQGLNVEIDEKKLSLLQKDVIKRGGEYLEAAPLVIPLYPSKGLRLKRKISYWLDEFQRLPYVSPYEDFQHLNRSSDNYEKRVVGVFHETLGLFVDHSAERKKLFCLRLYLGLPQKFYKVLNATHIYFTFH
ncbi:WHAT'S THIS FACTOR 9 protein [Thalictrum thalictroides]|uniref:WHAT'S THIS FACTOR 9 protein n=1 Tax=Thalictrum thalictroides TaxID=46969 RepID=A0A7J6WLI2_THATH|nr:WHAT'S THIS FACTOR 9 protein [Thalictrum thalictroides]